MISGYTADLLNKSLHYNKLSRWFSYTLMFVHWFKQLIQADTVNGRNGIKSRLLWLFPSCYAKQSFIPHCLFLNIFYWLCYYSCPISPRFTPLHPAHPLPPTFPHYSSCPWVITYKFFGLYVSYTILTLPMSIFYLPFMLLILCTFPPSLALPLPCW